MVAGALVGAAGGGGGTSLQGGNSGPAKSGITSDNSFNIGGNTGIGSSQGINSTMIAIAAIAVVAIFFLRK